MKTLFCTFNPFEDEDEAEESWKVKSSPRRSTVPAKLYAYLYTGQRDIQAGDYAVVHNGSEFKVVKVARVKPGIDDKVHKHVLAVFTQEDFKQYKAANEAIEEHRKVFDQLDYMLEQEDKLDRYRRMAERNPEAAALLQKAQVWTGPVIESAVLSGHSYENPAQQPAAPDMSTVKTWSGNQ